MAEEFATRAAIARGQFEKLQSLLRAILPTNQFYNRKYSTRGVHPVIDWDDFRARFPFTEKGEIVEDQRQSPPYGSNLTFPISQYTRYHQTSGTLGAPLRWLDTPESWEWMLGNWDRIFQAAEVGRSDRVLFAFSFGPFVGFWLAFEAAARRGSLCLPGGGLSTVARLRLLLDNEATVLCCTPTYALRLSEVALAENIDLSRSQLKTIIVAGEPGGSIPATRARLEAHWPRARIFDHHGMTEVGPVSYECPRRPGVLHVIESAYVAEIIDPATGKAVRRGIRGELVLTTLGRVGSPLIRYRTGDLVRQSALAGEASEDMPCGCGSYELALEGGILGRLDDMVIIRGVNVYPTAVEDLIRACPGVAEYRVQVTSRGELRELKVEIEPDIGCADPAELGRCLERSFQVALSLRVPVIVVGAGVLPRFEMKAKRWIRQGEP